MKFTSTTVALLLLSLFSVHAPASQPEDAMAAEAVLTRYFDALTHGDTATLRSLMAGDLLEKRLRLLNNPTYPAYLIDTYQNARFLVDRIEPHEPHSIVIDVSILVDQVTISQRRFLLRKEPLSSNGDATYRIYGEVDPHIY